MEIFKTVSQLRAAIIPPSSRLAFVPTMGALHQGHLSLVRFARAQCHLVTASIFVNPLQFGPQEDLAKYPRSFERDCELLEKENVDFLFAPAVDEMYPQGASTNVVVGELGDKLCGKSRPGHFQGVATVVAKLFNIVQPQVAFFGQKDAAQLAVIRRMVKDLNFPVEIKVGPIVREPDGLAMSSRNSYLNPQERKSALQLYKSLKLVQELFRQGERNTTVLVAAGKKLFMQNDCPRLDYFEVVDPENLDNISTINDSALVAVAAYAGATRLIDNIILQ
jgi:pantoate--beta-alanine ligase